MPLYVRKATVVKRMAMDQTAIIFLVCIIMVQSKQNLKSKDERYQSYSEKSYPSNNDEIMIPPEGTRKVILENKLFNQTINGQGGFELLQLQYYALKPEFQ